MQSIDRIRPYLNALHSPRLFCDDCPDQLSGYMRLDTQPVKLCAVTSLDHAHGRKHSPHTSVIQFAQNHQIDRSRLKPVGKGPSQLLNPARPEAPENRRVTIRRLDN